MQENRTTFYFVNVTSNRDNKKVADFTRKWETRYMKMSVKLRKKIVKETKKFVKQNNSFYIDERLVHEMRCLCFDDDNCVPPQIYLNDYCEAKRIVCVMNDGKIFFGDQPLPKSKKHIDSWLTLKNYLDNIDSHEFYILDNNRKKYTYDEFKAVMKFLLSSNK